MLSSSTSTEFAQVLQTINSIEDQVRAIRDTLDCLQNFKTPFFDGDFSAPQSAKAIAPRLEIASNPVTGSNFRDFVKNKTSIIDYFLGFGKKVLIAVDLNAQEIRLFFADSLNRRDQAPIRSLRLFESTWSLKPFGPLEYALGFSKVLDLRAIAWATALEYRELGYSCRIECGAEVIDVDDLIFEANPSALWIQLVEVPSCA